jgi:hypothetical protein
VVNKAPTTVIPEMAFEPDIKGVCKVAGTLEISSKPKKIDRTKMNTSKIASMVALGFPLIGLSK